MHNFHVSLLANVSFGTLMDTSVVANIFKDALCNEGIYSKELVSVSLNPILGSNAKNQQGYRKNEFLYSLVITGSATANTSLQLGKFLYQTLNEFTEKYARSYFLYSMYVERADKKDFCVQLNQERVFHAN